MEDLFEAENIRFLERIKSWRIMIPRCSLPDGTLKALPEVSNIPTESDSDATVKNSQGQSEEEETPSKKRKIEAKAKSTTSRSRIAARLGINGDTPHSDTMDKFSAIKMRRSCSFYPPMTSTPNQRKNEIPQLLEIKAEPGVKNVIQLDTTEVSQVPLTEAAPETVEPNTREQEEDVPEPQQTALQEKIDESTLKSIEPRESEASQVAQATEDSTNESREKINESTMEPIKPREEPRESEAPQVAQATEESANEPREVAQMTTHDNVTELEPEGTQTTTPDDATEIMEIEDTQTHEDATEPEIEVEMQESAPEEAAAVENETQEPAPEAAEAAAGFQATTEDATEAVELQRSVSFSFDGQLPVMKSLSQINLLSDVSMNLGDGTAELDTSIEFNAGDVDMNMFPQLIVANEEEVESSDIKTDAEYISDYKLKPVSVMIERVDQEKLRKILGHRMPDSHKVTKSGRVWKPKIIVDPSTSFQTRKNIKKRIDSKSSKANEKQKRGRPGREKKSDEHRSKNKKEHQSKEVKSSEHRSKDKKERRGNDKKEKKSEEKPRKEKKERPRQNCQDQFFEAPDEDFPVSEDIEETYVDFSTGRTFN